MRDFKFRAWNTLSDEIRNWEDIYWMPIAGLATETELKWMQYTGRNDKNGKEIYEHDIVTYKNKQGLHIGVVRYNDKYTAFRAVFDDFTWVDLTENIVVIGNIYENGDLLNG